MGVRYRVWLIIVIWSAVFINYKCFSGIWLCYCQYVHIFSFWFFVIWYDLFIVRRFIVCRIIIWTKISFIFIKCISKSKISSNVFIFYNRFSFKLSSCFKFITNIVWLFPKWFISWTNTFSTFTYCFINSVVIPSSTTMLNNKFLRKIFNHFLKTFFDTSYIYKFLYWNEDKFFYSIFFIAKSDVGNQNKKGFHAFIIQRGHI